MKNTNTNNMLKTSLKFKHGQKIPLIITKEQFLIAARNALTAEDYSSILNKSASLPEYIKTMIETHENAEADEMLITKDSFTKKSDIVHNNTYIYSKVAPILPLKFNTFDSVSDKQQYHTVND